MIISEADRLSEVKEYYFSVKTQQIAQLNKQGLNIISLAIGSPDMAPSRETVEKLYEVAKMDNSHGYQSYRGDSVLREAISRWSEKVFHVKSDPETEILPLMGSREGVMHISQAFVNPGDEVLVPNPGYPAYAAVSRLVGAKIRHYNLKENDDWQIDFDELEKQDFSNVKLMWLNYPNMPTGANVREGTYERLIELAHRHKFLICLDNPYSLVLNDTHKSILSLGERAWEVAVELNSLSKSHNMAGWRVGWVMGHRDYINTILKFKSNMDSGMFLGIQRAAVEALENSEEWHSQRNEIYAKRKEVAEHIASALGCRYAENQVGMFLWARIPDTEVSSESFADKILERARVFLTPGFIFGSNGERYIRISLCAKEEVFQEALERIKEAGF